MDSPIITTIIPTYRRPGLLKNAILSALNQTISNIKVCIYDNASGDNTRQVVEEIKRIDSRLHYYCHPSPVEAANNFQYGISSVDTPFFSILADDDLLAPDFYETALMAMHQFPNSSFFWGSTIDVKENGTMISANALQWEEAKLYEPPLGLFNVIENYFNWTGCIFRSEVAKQIQIDPLVKPIDLDFILRLAAQFSFSISKKPCALFIHHKKSYSSNCGVKLLWPSWIKMTQNIESIQTLSSSDKTKARNLMTAKLQTNLFSVSVGLASEGNFQQARETLAILFKQFPNYKLSKIFSFSMGYIEKYRWVYWFFKILLTLHRFRKSLLLKLEYGNFSRKLINQFFDKTIK